AIVTCLEYSHYKKHIGVRDLLSRGLVRSFRAAFPRNWWLILFCVIIIPLGSLTLSSSYLENLKIPEYINSVIQSTPLYSATLGVLTVIAFLLSLRWMYIFHLFFLEGMTASQAARESAIMMKGRYIKTILSFIWWMIKVTIKVALVYAIIFIILAIPLFIFASSDGIYAFLMGVCDLVQETSNFALSIVMMLSSYAWITSRYYAIRSEYGLIDEDKNLVESRMHPRAARVLIAISCAIFVAVSSSSAYWILESGYAFDGEDLVETTKVVAHRGCGNVAPENTVEAYLKAIEAKADYGELDVHWTRDRVVVLSHDDNLIKTGGVDINIWNISCEELMKLDRGSHFSEEYAGTRFSTLEEVMIACKDRLDLIIEIKMDGHDAGIERDVIDLIYKHDYENDCYVASLSYDCIKRVKEYDAGIKTLYFAPFAIGDVNEMEYADAIGIEMTFLSQNLVSSLHEAGKPVFVWTVDETDHIRRCVELGVDFIISNDPEATRNVINEEDNDAYRLLIELRRAFLELAEQLEGEQGALWS
ncbi:MAG: glycerophosphodiester phosphodiesterase family protein, partial [Clostridia bacterium]|nr:glycerophosphodiester phosphodiesterase family protein [Clostridia bacterium]